jgi:predicted metal-binding membrane protein
MELERRLKNRILFVILSLSILVWVVLLANPGGIMGMEHCHMSTCCAAPTKLETLLEMNPFSDQLMGWGLMVVAMMLPKLVFPIEQIYLQSFRQYRFVNAALFVIGYTSAWMLAGIAMVWIIILSNLLFPQSYLPALVVLVLALVWQFSPIKQRFLNLGHEHKILSAFGWQKYRDALVYGVEHGVWCIGAGWALMLFPMLLPQGHNVAMLLVTLIMLSEHMEHPKYPKWNFNLRLRLFKIIAAQTKIKLTAWLL